MMLFRFTAPPDPSYEVMVNTMLEQKPIHKGEIVWQHWYSNNGWLIKNR